MASNHNHNNHPTPTPIAPGAPIWVNVSVATNNGNGTIPHHQHHRPAVLLDGTYGVDHGGSPVALIRYEDHDHAPPQNGGNGGGGPQSQEVVVPLSSVAPRVPQGPSPSSPKRALPTSHEHEAGGIPSPGHGQGGIGSGASAQHHPGEAATNKRQRTHSSGTGSVGALSSPGIGMSSTVGMVGYRFRKRFPPFGVYEGRVVDVLSPGTSAIVVAGRDRRCVYSNSYVEDLSLGELLAQEPVIESES